jgi:hypothetical protein
VPGALAWCAPMARSHEPRRGAGPLPGRRAPLGLRPTSWPCGCRAPGARRSAHMPRRRAGPAAPGFRSHASFSAMCSKPAAARRFAASSTAWYGVHAALMNSSMSRARARVAAASILAAGIAAGGALDEAQWRRGACSGGGQAGAGG